jgi:hypothetical protein
VVEQQSHPVTMTSLRSVPEAGAAAQQVPLKATWAGPADASAATVDVAAGGGAPYPPSSLPHLSFAHEQRMLKSEVR